MAAAVSADVVVLNENVVDSGDTLAALQSQVARAFHIPLTINERRFHCFSKNPSLDLTEVHAGFRTSVRTLKLEDQGALLGLVHGVDVRNYDSESRQSFAERIANDFRFVKKQQENKRLILVGDFNMNPFERGMNLAAGMNAMMTRACAKRGVRTHLNEEFDFYYNPMWSLFGDNTRPGWNGLRHK